MADVLTTDVNTSGLRGLGVRCRFRVLGLGVRVSGLGLDVGEGLGD